MIFELLRRLVDLMSPELRQHLCEFLAQLQERAKSTDNQWDDVVVYFVRAMLGCL